MNIRNYEKRPFRRHIPAISPKKLFLICRRVLNNTIRKHNLNQHEDGKHDNEYFCWCKLNLFRFLIEISSVKLSTQIKGFSKRTMKRRSASRMKKTKGRSGAAVFPSRQGLFQARKNFPFEVLMDAYIELTVEITRILFEKTKGRVLPVIIDGMNLPINAAKADPENLVKTAGDEIRAAMHLNGAVIPDFDLFFDVEMQDGSLKNEHAAALILVKRVTERVRQIDPDKEILFIMDRGYFSFNLATACEELGVRYLIRVQEKVFKTYLNGQEVECEMDFRSGTVLIDWKLAVESGFGPKDLEQLPDYIRKNVTGKGVEAVTSHDGRYVFEARFAAVEINTDPDKERFEYLITNLPEEKYSLKDLKAEYKTRWQVEINYFLLKHGDGLLYLHSAQKNLVLQEVYACLYQHNRAAILLNRKENTVHYNGYDHVPAYGPNLKSIHKWFVGTDRISADELLCGFEYNDNKIEKIRYKSMRKKRGSAPFTPRPQ